MNILLILTDEHTYEAIGANGNPLVKTPHLDRLASRGVRFTRHSASAPACTPSRASILTGQYTRTHGAGAVGCTLSRSTVTLADRLMEAGYATGAFGKMHLEPELTGRAIGHPRGEPYYGFAEHAISEDDQRGMYLEWVEANHAEYAAEVRRTSHEDSPIRRAPAWVGNPDHPGHLFGYYPSNLPQEVTQTAWIADQTCTFLHSRSTDHRPFFALCSFVQPHHPWNPTWDYLAMYDPAEMPIPDRADGAHGGPDSPYNDGRHLTDRQLQEVRAAYYAMVTQIDDEVGRILSRLDALGLTESTAVIFTTDHGDYNTERGMVRKIAGWYESLLHIPMIAMLPGGAAGREYTGLTQLEDVAPTILALAGLDIPPGMQGHSLAGGLRGESPSPRCFAYYDYAGTIGVADERWKLIHYVPRDGRSPYDVLTDVQTDPSESVNRIDDPAAQDAASRLKGELFRWLADTPIYCPPREAPW